MAQTIGLNLVMGFITPGIDNACHIGGLLSGAILGGLFAYSKQVNLRMGLAVSAASLALIYFAANVQPSEELLALKQQLQAELQVSQAEKVLAKEKMRIADEIAADAKVALKPVDAKTAAGEQIDISQHLSQNAFVSDMQLSSDGKKLLILVGELDNILLVFDTQTKKITDVIKGPKLNFESDNCQSLMCEGKGADSLKLSADGRFAYVSSMQKNSVSVIDLAQKTVIASMPASQYPRALAANKNSTRGYVANGVDNTVSTFDLTKNLTIAGTIALAGGTAKNLPFGHADGVFIVNNDSQLWVLDAVLNQFEVFDMIENGSPKSSKTVQLSENYFRNGAIAQDGKLWVVGSEAAESYDTTKGELEKTIKFCYASYYDIAASPINNTLAIVEDDVGYSQKYVHLIKTSTAKTIGRYPVFGSQDPVFSLDGKLLYVIGRQQNEQGNAKFNLNILSLDKTLDVSKANDESELLCNASSS